MNMEKNRVTVVTVTYGDRWEFLSQVINAVIKDEHLEKLIIVDNASSNKDKIEKSYNNNLEKIIVIRNEKNIGSAGGFNQALAKARETHCDYVLLLDDDNVPEDGFVNNFIGTMKFFKNKKVVLLGNRLNLEGNEEFFYHQTIKDDSPRGTFFQIFSFSKFLHFFKILTSKNKNNLKRGPFVPIAPTEGFVYGGSFVPIEAVRKAALPDKELVLYGDDVEYSWNVKNLGYSTYLCASPYIYDVDRTFVKGSHIFGLFEKETKPFKVYYRIRNMVKLSVRHSSQSKIVLFITITIWILGLYILGFFRFGPTLTFFKRVRLIFLAVIAGYSKKTKTPKEAVLP